MNAAPNEVARMLQLATGGGGEPMPQAARGVCPVTGGQQMGPGLGQLLQMLMQTTKNPQELGELLQMILGGGGMPAGPPMMPPGGMYG